MRPAFANDAEGMALFRAVLSHPDEDTPRLVFADWLQEHGEEKRAAFIRAQVDLFHRTSADSEAVAVREFFAAVNFVDLGDIDWAPVSAELGALFAAEQAAEKVNVPPAKSYDLPKIKSVSFTEVERSFLTGVTVHEPDSFLKNAGAIFRAAPVTGIEFSALTAGHAREFIARGYLARVRRLAFWGGTEPEAIRVLGEHRDAAGVTELELLGEDDVGEHLPALAAGTHWTGVTRLEVPGVFTGDLDMDRAMAELLRKPQFRRLKYLIAYGSGLGDASCRAIANVGLTELRYLDLSINTISNAGARAIAAAKSLPKLRYLDLGLCDLTGAAVSALIVTPKLSSLAVLRLDGASAEGLDPKALVKANRAPTLRVLHLEGANLKRSDVAALGMCPAVQGLWFLSFQGTRLSDTALAAFTERSRFGQLTAFDLSDNKLSDRGMAALGAWPGMASLQSLDISGNKSGDAGARALTASTHLKQLKRLNVRGRGTARLRKHFGKKVVP
jgi:uncharacterized protein (TIGR02996 family)